MIFSMGTVHLLKPREYANRMTRYWIEEGHVFARSLGLTLTLTTSSVPRHGYGMCTVPFFAG